VLRHDEQQFAVEQGESPPGSLPGDRPQTRANEVLRGIYNPAQTITPPGTIGYVTTSPLTGGVDRARQLLAEAGYPDGQGFPEVKLAWPKLVTYDLVAQALQQMCGIP